MEIPQDVSGGYVVYASTISFIKRYSSLDISINTPLSSPNSGEFIFLKKMKNTPKN